MQIKSLIIYGFGKWQNQSFDVNAPLTMFVGENEAGKSTIVQFIQAILFGFPTKRANQNQYSPQNGAPYGGVLLVHNRGVDYRIERIEGPKRGTVTITNADGLIMPDGFLDQLLGSLNERLFQSTLVINSDELAKIYKLTEAEATEMVERIGANESEQLLDVKQTLDRQAADIYKPLGRLPLLNQKLNERRALIDRLKITQQQYPHYLAVVTDHQRLTTQLVEMTAQVAALDQEIQQLTQIMPMLNGEPAASTKTTISADSVHRLRQLQAEIQLLRNDQPEKTPNTVTTVQAELIALATEHQQLSDRIDDLEQRYATAGVMPRPLTTAERAQFQADDSSVMSRTTRQSQRVTSARPIQWQFGLGGLVALLLNWLFFSGGLRLFGLVVGLILLGVTSWQYWQLRTHLDASTTMTSPDSTVVERIQVDAQLGSIPVSRWLAIQPELKAYREAIEQIEQLSRRQKRLQRLNQLLNDQQQLLLANGVQTMAELERQYDDHRLFDAGRSQRVELRNQLSPTLQQLASSFATAQAAEQKRQDMIKARERLVATQRQAQQEAARQTGELAQLSADGTVSDLTQALANMDAEITPMIQSWLEKQLGMNWITQVLKLATGQQMPAIMRLASEYFSILTNKRYTQISLTEQNLMVQRDQNQTIPVIELSTATAQQVFVAIKFAQAVVLNEAVQLPLLVDDGFVHFDDERKQQVMALLRQVAKKVQVITFGHDGHRQVEGTIVINLNDLEEA